MAEAGHGAPLTLPLDLATNGGGGIGLATSGGKAQIWPPPSSTMADLAPLSSTAAGATSAVAVVQARCERRCMGSTLGPTWARIWARLLYFLTHMGNGDHLY